MACGHREISNKILKVTSNMLKIGIITPFSNEFPFLASDFVDGLKLAFYKNKKVEFVHIEAERGVANEVSPLFRRLIVKDRVDLIVAFLDTIIVQTVKELIDQTQTPVILSGMGTRLPTCSSDSSPYIFHNTFRMWESCWLSGKIAATTYGKKLGIFSSFFDCGYPLIYAHTKGAESAGGEPAFFNITHKDKSEEEFLNAKTIAAENSVDYYFASYYGKERAFMIDWFKREGLASNPIIATPAIQPKGDEVDYVTSWHKNIDSSENLEFIKTFKKETGDEATEFSMLGYENGLLISSALQSNELPFNSEQFVESLKEVNITGPRGKMAIIEHTQSTYSDHFQLFTESSNGEQKTSSIPYPLEMIKTEIESNQPSNLFGWQNTYLCK